ncbi:hypothetical protein CYMTET_20314 [Cymbomonas tetramitiformis]|uniref:Fe2OG dioxygenase domain-containing protein n=1 Tax=Cymbomonas tetramitiformis TaxID=36881 RepID=A0AAE0G4A8_9CHLO|nr:hypothetical protein CYMTET_20314 [Cymbomonas tetramitiformis]|eukprot:gene24300-29518_t
MLFRTATALIVAASAYCLPYCLAALFSHHRRRCKGLTVIRFDLLEARDANELNRLRHALSTDGFVHLVEHGTCPAPVLAAARAFFALPADIKARFSHPRKGFVPVNGCVNAVRPPALHEKFSCGRVSGVDRTDPYYCPYDSSPYGSVEEAQLYFGDENIFPDEVAAPCFQALYEGYYEAMEALVRSLHAAIAISLGLDEHFFEAALAKHVTNLAALHYPGGVAEADNLRVKPHTDPTTLTILAHEGGDASGLQVLAHTDDLTDRWVDVGRHADALVVNVGDLLKFWTNGHLTSTRHRVKGCMEPRLSLVYFCNPGYDTWIEAPPALCPHGPRARFVPFRSGDRSHFAQQARDQQGLPDRQLLSKRRER